MMISKNSCQIEHPRNFIKDMFSGLIAYSLLPKKPFIKYDRNYLTQIAIFHNRNQVNYNFK